MSKSALPDRNLSGLEEYRDKAAQLRDLLDDMSEMKQLQLSNKALNNLIRGFAPKAVSTLVDLLDSPNHNVRLGAAKSLLSKVMPDLKAVEHSSDGTLQGLVIVKKDNDTIDAEIVEYEKTDTAENNPDS